MATVEFIKKRIIGKENEIILKQDIIGLGYKNDIGNVKSGYGRNFLIPTGKAVIASPSAKKQLAEDLKQQAHKLEAIKAEAKTVGIRYLAPEHADGRARRPFGRLQLRLL